MQGALKRQNSHNVRVICLESQDDVAENGEALDEQDSEEEQDDDNEGEG